MPISITKTPTPIAFAGCNNIFEIQSTGAAIPGAKARIILSVDTTLATPGDTVTLVVDTRTITYLFDSTDAPVPNPAIGPDYRFTSDRELFNKLYSSYYLTDYTVRYNNADGIFSIIIESIAPSRHALSVKSTSGIVTPIGIATPGADTVPLPNYRIAARYQIGSGQYTPWAYLTPQDGKVTVDTAILQPYLPRPALPRHTGLFALLPIDNPGITYRLQAAEIYGTDPVLQSQAESAPLTLYPGELSDTCAPDLLPDWADALPDTDLLSRIAVIGSAHGAVRNLTPSQLDYLYLASFGSVRTAKILVERYTDSGLRTTTVTTATLRPGNIYSLPINPSLFGADSQHRTAILTILDQDETEIFRRTYLLQPADRPTAQLYLAGKYRLLRSFIPADISRQVTFEADRLHLRHRPTQAVTDRRQLYTVTSAPLTPIQADTLADTLATDCAYLQLGDHAYPCHIDPATIAASTTTRNLTVITFTLWIESHQLHPMPHGIPGPLQLPPPDIAPFSLDEDPPSGEDQPSNDEQPDSLSQQ